MDPGAAQLDPGNATSGRERSGLVTSHDAGREGTGSHGSFILTSLSSVTTGQGETKLDRFLEMSNALTLSAAAPTLWTSRTVPRLFGSRYTVWFSYRRRDSGSNKSPSPNRSKSFSGVVSRRELLEPTLSVCPSY